MKKIGLNDSVILGVNRRGLDVYNTLQNHSHHGLNVIGFIKGYDDPENLMIIYLYLYLAMNQKLYR